MTDDRIILSLHDDIVIITLGKLHIPEIRLQIFKFNKRTSAAAIAIKQCRVERLIFIRTVCGYRGRVEQKEPERI